MRDFIADFSKDVTSRWKLLWGRNTDPERRIFAGLELFCFPVSIITLFVLLPLRIAATQTGTEIPPAWNHALTIMLSAAVGYITNYIAIEMLFKPYRKKPFHPLSLATFGYWQQGLVPKNKAKIGAELGRQIETRLLDPKQLANELCDMVLGFMQDEDVAAKFRQASQKMLSEHEKRITALLIPQIENALGSALDTLVTREQVSRLWEAEIAPRLASYDNRSIIASHIVAGLQRRAPELVETIKVELRQISFDYLSRKLPFGFGADTLSDGLVEFIRWHEIENRLRAKLGEESTGQLVREELSQLADRIHLWLQSSESGGKIDELITELKNKITAVLRLYLSRSLPSMTTQMIESEELWAWVENDLMDSIKPRIEILIKRQGKRKIMEKLNLSERVAEAIDKQDVKEFHDMIGSITAQHLGAIQVLGYFLGGIVGVAQIFW